MGAIMANEINNLADDAARAKGRAEECARWKAAIGAEMPADFKDWHQNSDAELPEIAAWVIRNLREREAQLAEAERAADPLVSNPNRGIVGDAG